MYSSLICDFGSRFEVTDMDGLEPSEFLVGHISKASKLINNFESLYKMKHFSFRLAVINVCPVLVPTEWFLRTHLPTSEGWTAELTVGMWLVVPTTGFEPTRVDLA